MKLASRLEAIDPFYVMEMAKAARALADGPDCDPRRGGEPMIYLNIGEPDFTAAPGVVESASACLQAGRTQYTPSTGLPALRQAISRWYQQRWHLEVAPERIVVTSGASAALQLITLALVDAGDEILMPDPCYPCNRHFVAAAGGLARLIPTKAAQRFQLDADSVRAHWNARTRGVLLASPSNPTGTSIEPSELRTMVQTVRELGGVTLVDEIYLGLSYESRFGNTALALGEDVISINSFSKYFGMTGWRLGWLVLPPDLVAPVEKLAQNLYICASAVAQHAALACFEPQAIAQFEQRRGELVRRRDRAVEGMNQLGLSVPVVPDGAFYVWAQTRAHAKSSWDFCFDVMRRAHVVLTPGRDFGPAMAEDYLRLSFATSVAHLDTALQRLQRLLGTGET